MLLCISPSPDLRVITNICYGGGLTELTSSNVCVFANQQRNKTAISESLDLNLYGQNSPYMEDLDLKIQDLKTSIAESVKNWDKLSPQDQAAQRQQTQLEAQQIKIKLAQLEKDRRKYETLNLELDLLKYGDDNMIKEYSSIRKCLEYVYKN